MDKEKQRHRNREAEFEELAQVILEAWQSKIHWVSRQAGDPSKNSSLLVETHLALGKASFFFFFSFKTFTCLDDGDPSSHNPSIMENNVLYSKSIDVNVNLNQKHCSQKYPECLTKYVGTLAQTRWHIKLTIPESSPAVCLAPCQFHKQYATWVCGSEERRHLTFPKWQVLSQFHRRKLLFWNFKNKCCQDQ